MLKKFKTSQQVKRTIQQFADEIGLVYFGTIDKYSDEHHLVRGLTLTSHRQPDQHYCLGTQNGYDISLVQRQLTIQRQLSSWLVLDIALQQADDLPHVFIGSNQHSEHFYAQLFMTSRHLRRLTLGTFESHSAAFSEHYALYAAPTKHLDLEQLFTAQITEAIGRHFLPLAIEVVAGHLYIYAENQPVNQTLLQSMLRNGLWLAEYLDHRATSK